MYFCLFLLLCAKWGTCHISPKFAEPSINIHKDENVFQVADGWVEREGQADLMLLDNSAQRAGGSAVISGRSRGDVVFERTAAPIPKEYL